MKPVRISLKNYKSYGDTGYEIDLSQESVKLIVGESGSGKTSFVDAMMWALYGKSTSKTDNVVNRKNKKNCKVEFDFYIDTFYYSVVRFRKDDNFGNSLFLYKDGENVSRANASDTQQLIQDIIGIPYESMRSAVIFSSEIYLSFMREKETTRLKIIEGILQLKIVNKWAEELKKKRKPITEKIQELETKKEKIDYGINTINDNIKNYTSRVEKTLKDLKERWTNAKEDKKALEEELESLSEIDADKEREKNRRYNEVKEHNEKIDSDSVQYIAKIQNTTRQEQRISEIDTELSKVKGINVEDKIQEIESHNKAVSNNQQIRSKISELKSEKESIEHLKSSLNSFHEKKKEKEKEVEHFLHAETCPTCGQDITQEIIESKNLVESRKEEIKELDEKIEKLEKEIEEGEKNNKALDEKIANIEKQLVDVDETKEFKQTSEELRKLDKERTGLEHERSRLTQELEQISQINAKYQETINELNAKKVDDTNIYPSEYSNEYLDNLTNRGNEINEEIRKLDNEINTIKEKTQSTYDKEYVEELKNKRTALKSSLTKTTNALEKERFEDEHYEFLINLFSNKESSIKKDFVNKIVPIFNKKVNEFLPLFLDGDITIEFNKNLTETIYVGGEEVDFEDFSSGEKKRFDLSIAFSLFQLVKEFFSSSVSFVIFDEILDGGLDEDALKRVINVVNSLGETNSVFIISHNDSLKEWFSNHISVSKDKNGYSRIAYG